MWTAHDRKGDDLRINQSISKCLQKLKQSRLLNAMYTKVSTTEVTLEQNGIS